VTAVGSITRSSASRWRQVQNGIATAAMVGSLVVVLIPLALILGYVVSRGLPALSWDFLTADIPIVSRTEGPGVGPAVVGTLIVTGAATLLAVPLGILGGIYLNEYGARSSLGRTIRFLAEVMTGVPSIVMGLFVFAILVVNTQQYNGFAGAVALACLMLPVVIRTTETMLELVPDDLRESAYALGGRKAGTILRVVLPAAAPGIVSGALLAVARAAGETAPLLFTVGVVNATNTNLLDGQNTTLSLQIFKNAQQVFPGPQQRAWGAALTLVVIVFVCTIAARLISSRFTRKHAHP